jgi:hypothetical protein
MKKILFLLSVFTVLTFVTVNCGDNGSLIKYDFGTPDPCGNADNLHLCAKVENASEYSSIVAVKLMVYDLSVNRHVEFARGEWKNGGFTIELPQTLAPNHLRPLIGQVGANHPTNILAQPTMVINNENVSIVDAYFVGVDENSNAVATFSPVKTIFLSLGRTCVNKPAYL